jgi:hypothetical protein
MVHLIVWFLWSILLCLDPWLIFHFSGST